MSMDLDKPPYQQKVSINIDFMMNRPLTQTRVGEIGLEGWKAGKPAGVVIYRGNEIRKIAEPLIWAVLSHRRFIGCLHRPNTLPF